MREWQPIETAPKDGTQFLAFGSYIYPGDKSRTEYFGLAEYNPVTAKNGYPWEDEEGCHPPGFYSHWMRLPEPPQ